MAPPRGRQDAPTRSRSRSGSVSSKHNLQDYDEKLLKKTIGKYHSDCGHFAVVKAVDDGLYAVVDFRSMFSKPANNNDWKVSEAKPYPADKQELEVGDYMRFPWKNANRKYDYYECEILAITRDKKKADVKFDQLENDRQAKINRSEDPENLALTRKKKAAAAVGKQSAVSQPKVTELLRRAKDSTNPSERARLDLCASTSATGVAKTPEPLKRKSTQQQSPKRQKTPEPECEQGEEVGGETDGNPGGLTDGVVDVEPQMSHPSTQTFEEEEHQGETTDGGSPDASEPESGNGANKEKDPEDEEQEQEAEQEEEQEAEDVGTGSKKRVRKPHPKKCRVTKDGKVMDVSRKVKPGPKKPRTKSEPKPNFYEMVGTLDHYWDEKQPDTVTLVKGREVHVYKHLIDGWRRQYRKKKVDGKPMEKFMEELFFHMSGGRKLVQKYAQKYSECGPTALIGKDGLETLLEFIANEYALEQDDQWTGWHKHRLGTAVWRLGNRKKQVKSD